MEGLIPFVYRAIVQYRNEREGVLSTWFPDSPSASYMRLPTGDSGRFLLSDKQVFESEYDHKYSTSSAPTTPMPTSASSTTTQIILSTGVQSPVYRLTSRRFVA